MRQIQSTAMFRVIPFVLVMAGVLLGNVHPLLATKFPPKSAPNSNASGGRRAMSLCQASPIVASPTQDDTLAISPVQVSPAPVVVASSDAQTLLVQLPATSAQQAVVKLEDAQGNDLYYAQFPLAPATQTTGSTAISVTRLPVPKTAVTLEPDQPYRWSLGIICNHTIDPNDPVFEGWL